MCKEIIYLIYVYKKDLALNNRQCLICQPENHTKPNKIIHLFAQFKFNKNQFHLFEIRSKGKFRILVWHANLIRHLISPKQDDLSYSAQTFHFQPANRVSCQTHSLWLENAAQCRRLTGGPSSSSMDTRGNLSNLWIPCKESQLNIN